MTDAPRDWKLDRTSVVASAVFLIGCVLALTLHGAFFAVAALGAVGPTLLRQAGLLDDQDEFQREAAASAGTHAFVAAIVVTVSVLVAKAWRGPLGHDPEAGPWLILFGTVLGTRFAAYAWRFWDRKRAALRILLAFGTLWLVFVVLSHGADPKALAVEALVVAAPFFALALLCQRFPRSVGGLLVLLAIGGAFFFHVFTPRPGASGPFAVVLFLLLPLALTGVGLLGVGHDREEEA